TTQRRRHHGDWHAAVQIGTIALEECVRGKRQEDVEVARRAATRAGFAFSGKPDARAVLDARRNIDRQSPLARDAARSSTAGAGIVDHLAAALTVRAGPLESEKALGVADLALARAGRTGLRLRPSLGARPRAGLASDRGGDTDLRRFPRIGGIE